MITLRCVVCLVALLSAAQVSLAFYDGTDVVSLTPANFEKAMKKGVWMVEFYAPWCGHCKNLKPEWEKAATALKGILGVGAVDADAHRELGGQYNVKGFPTIKIMYANPETGEIKSVDYQGPRESKDIVQWAMTKAQNLALKRLGLKSSSSSSSSSSGSNNGFYGGSQVTTLTDKTFHTEVINSDDMWFVEFYAPWCGHCKALKPAWVELAQNLDGRVKVGAVDCTTNEQTCSEFGVQGFPTIKFFGSSKEHPEDYQGGRDSGSLTAYATERWSKDQPPPEAKELTDNDLWIDRCLGHDADPDTNLKAVKPKQLCLVAFLPHILDSKASGRQDYLDMLKDVATSYKDRPFSWFWVEGGAQPELEKSVGVGGFGYPAFIALNPGKSKYATLRGAFNQQSVKEFMDAVRSGREPISDVTLPENEKTADGLIKTIAPWDGGDGAESLEEEFSLEDLGLGGSDGEDAKEEL